MKLYCCSPSKIKLFLLRLVGSKETQTWHPNRQSLCLHMLLSINCILWWWDHLCYKVHILKEIIIFMAQVKLDQTIWLLTVKKTIRCAFLLAEDQTIYPKYRKWKKKKIPDFAPNGDSLQLFQFWSILYLLKWILHPPVGVRMVVGNLKTVYFVAEQQWQSSKGILTLVWDLPGFPPHMAMFPVRQTCWSLKCHG